MKSKNLFLSFAFGLSIFSLFAVSRAQALHFVVIGPCQATPILDVQSANQTTNLGDLTISTLGKYQIAFHGDVRGITSIANSPVESAAIEYLPDHSFRAYGWCVEVNNIQPNQSPRDVQIDGNTQLVKWFYAYSLNDQGYWKDYCTPAYIQHSLPICH